MKLVDIIKMYGLNPKECLFARYSPVDCVINDQKILGKQDYLSFCFSECKQKYLIYFQGIRKNYDILKGVYKVGNLITDYQKVEGTHCSQDKKIQLDIVPQFDELIDRLEIYYDTPSQARRVKYDYIDVTAIYNLLEERHAPYFSSYDDVYLTYKELDEIISNDYDDWKNALKSINAIYMIVDSSTGKQYIGSSYGKDGLYGRWSSYVKTQGDGGNMMLKELKEKDPEHYLKYNFTILKILPHSVSSNEAIDFETKYKNKFLTKKFGLNLN